MDFRREMLRAAPMPRESDIVDDEEEEVLCFLREEFENAENSEHRELVSARDGVERPDEFTPSPETRLVSVAMQLQSPSWSPLALGERGS